MKTLAKTDPGVAPDKADGMSDAARARILASYGLDSVPEDPALSDIARFAAQLCDARVALVNIVEPERQRFIGRQGIDQPEAAASPASFCVHTMRQAEPVVVADAQADPRFAENSFVAQSPHLRFYAGVPLVSEEGVPLGALCVTDPAPRPEGLTELQRTGLEVLARAAMGLLTARRHGLAARREVEERERQFRTLADSIPAIAWSADAQGNFDYFNPQMVKFTGQSDDTSGSAFHPDDWKRADAAWKRSLASGETYQIEHRLRRHDGEYRWMISRAVPVRDAEGEIVRWFGTAVDIHDVYAMSESRDLLAKELSHRIKNIFAVVAGLVSLSARSKPEHKPFADELTDTIRALGRAHDFVRAAEGTERDSLHGLLRELFAPYGAGEAARVRIAGHDCTVSARATTPLALVFHELATNSAKYGALGKPGGHVDLVLEDAGENIRLIWTEHGGKTPRGAPKPGFGSRLVEMSITGQLGGSWDRRFEPGGMVAELVLSMEAVCGCA